MFPRFFTFFLGTLLANTSLSQDFGLFARCNEVTKQLELAAAPQSRSDRESLLYDLYVDLKSLYAEEKNKKSTIPLGLLRRCQKLKNEALDKAYLNSDPVVKNNYKVQWQMGEITQARKHIKDALIFYDRAAALAPDDAEVQLRYYKVWDVQMRGGLNQKDRALQSSELRHYLSTAESRLLRITALQEARPEIRIEAYSALCDLYQILLDRKMLRDPAKLKNCWESLLQVDRDHLKALRWLVDYHTQKETLFQALSYLEALRRLKQASAADNQQLAMLYLNAKRYRDLLALVETELKSDKRNKIYWNLRARAEQALGEDASLKKTLAVLKKIDPRSPLLRQEDALKYEREGDEFLFKKLPSSALSSYRKAMTFLTPQDPLLFKVQRKAALIIFDHYKDPKAPRNSATEIDMKEVVRLLSPILTDKAPDPSILRIATKAALWAKNYAFGELSCKILFERFGDLNNRAEIAYCAEIYMKLGKKDAVRDLFESSEKKAQYSREDISAERKKFKL